MRHRRRPLRGAAVGGDSFANQVTAGARAERRVLTPLQREINGMIRLTLLVAAFLMVVLTVSAVAWRDPFVELVQRLVVVVGLVPQGLLLAIVVAYALGAMRVAGQGALVQQTNAIESLSNVDTFCLDKTGTLTTNRLKLADVRPWDRPRRPAEPAEPFRRQRDDRQQDQRGDRGGAAGREAAGDRRGALLLGAKVECPRLRRERGRCLRAVLGAAHTRPRGYDLRPPGYPSVARSLRAGAPEMLRPHLLQGAHLNGQVDEWAPGARVSCSSPTGRSPSL